MKDESLSLMDHLTELRKRLIRSLIAISIGFLICYGFKEQLFFILVAPLQEAMGTTGSTLIFTGLPEAFFTYLKVALLGGLLLASPYILTEFWLFVSPGLYKKEKKLLIPIIFLSVFFFLGGALFGYFIVFPWGFRFFLGFATESIHALPAMKEYLAFSSKMLLAFGLVFEMPLVLTAMARMGLVTPAFLAKNRKYALLLFFGLAAILTPPDVVTQVMMAIPLVLLYEISIIGARVFQRKPMDQKDP
ncbi:sec-independent protein translocase protein TatC [Desulfobotulus alkaliphilus]|uniref:Sec-independent protein translocase protein TatC n=1 Tax=Desulfobotulus alkaliphilus TaxID=622671 RepID=A0A562S2B8_9BACT|nr:twin-arginine translocase subunit TatC [Desulfobotulus alkaliphilus]TWI75521.1 sec-independent protein translocase protein TatC [Desulfobotulus alkaliphilus]